MYRRPGFGTRGQRGMMRGGPIGSFQPTRPFRGRRAARRGFPSLRRPYRPYNQNERNIDFNENAGVESGGTLAFSNRTGCQEYCNKQPPPEPITPKVKLVNNAQGAEIPKSPIPLPPIPPYHVDVVFQLLVAKEKDMEETCIKMREHLSILSQEEKGAIDISSKQIMGFALQSQEGAARAAKVLRFLNEEMPGFFKFVCIKRWLWHLMPRPRGNSVYTQLSSDQIFNFGIFLASLYVHFEHTPLREDIHHYLRKLLDCMAIDCTPEGSNRFNHVISLCGIGASPLESAPCEREEKGTEKAVKNEPVEQCKKVVEGPREADHPKEPSKGSSIPKDVRKEEPKELPPAPVFQEVKRGSRGRPFRKGRVYHRRGVYWESRAESNR